MKTRKRSGVDDGIEWNMIEGINDTLDLLLKNTNELNAKVDQLLAENRSLKQEIEKLKGSQKNCNVITGGAIPSYASIAANQSNNS